MNENGLIVHSDNLPKLSAKDAILALLISPDNIIEGQKPNWNAPIDGKTRLVKELFLIEKETKSGKDGIFSFFFTPGPYGPSSIEVTNTMKVLEKRGLINVEKNSKSSSLIISLTKSGEEEAEKIWNRLSREVKIDVFHIKSLFRKYTYWQLISYVYRAYPAFTSNSIIRDRVLNESLL